MSTILGDLTVWDNDGFITMPPRALSEEETTMAIQVTPFLGNSWQLGVLPQRHFATVKWEHVTIPTSKWVKFSDSIFDEFVIRDVKDPVTSLASSQIVLITGCHMSPNPCPGVGIARSIRAALFPNTKMVLIAVDNNDELFSGMTDPVFDSCRAVTVMNPFCESTLDEKWDALAGLLSHYPTALLIPVAILLGIFDYRYHNFFSFRIGIVTSKLWLMD